MGSCRIWGNTQNDGIQFQEFAVQVTESLGFLGSPGGVVLRVEIQHHMFALEIFKGHNFTIRIR